MNTQNTWNNVQSANHQLHNTKLVIDGDQLCSSLHQSLLSSDEDDPNRCRQLSGGDYHNFANHVEKFFADLKVCSVEVIVIVDGKSELDVNDKNWPFLSTVMYEVIHKQFRTTTIYRQSTGVNATNLISIISRAFNCPILSDNGHFLQLVSELSGGVIKMSKLLKSMAKIQSTKLNDNHQRYIKCKIYRLENKNENNDTIEHFEQIDFSDYYRICDTNLVTTSVQSFFEHNRSILFPGISEIPLEMMDRFIRGQIQGQMMRILNQNSITQILPSQDSGISSAPSTSSSTYKSSSCMNDPTKILTINLYKCIQGLLRTSNGDELIIELNNGIQIQIPKLQEITTETREEWFFKIVQHVCFTDFRPVSIEDLRKLQNRVQELVPEQKASKSLLIMLIALIMTRHQNPPISSEPTHKEIAFYRAFFTNIIFLGFVCPSFHLKQENTGALYQPLDRENRQFLHGKLRDLSRKMPSTYDPQITDWYKCWQDCLGGITFLVQVLNAPNYATGSFVSGMQGSFVQNLTAELMAKKSGKKEKRRFYYDHFENIILKHSKSVKKFWPAVKKYI